MWVSFDGSNSGPYNAMLIQGRETMGSGIRPLLKCQKLVCWSQWSLTTCQTRWMSERTQTSTRLKQMLFAGVGVEVEAVEEGAAKAEAGSLMLQLRVLTLLAGVPKGEVQAVAEEEAAPVAAALRPARVAPAAAQKQSSLSQQGQQSRGAQAHLALHLALIELGCSELSA